MQSPHTFATIAQLELDDPESFLPTSIRYEGENILWTKPAYATYSGTPVNHEMVDSTFLCDPSSIILPPNLARLAESEDPTEHQQRYLRDYKFAAATIDHWKETKHPNETALTQAITIWKNTCDKLTVNPYFAEGWLLPAFFPIYSYQCVAGIQIFFANKTNSFWKGQNKQANEMFASWEAFYFYVAARKYIPIPKCLWYHKYHYVCYSRQPDTWKNFFHESSFAEWGRDL